MFIIINNNVIISKTNEDNRILLHSINQQCLIINSNIEPNTKTQKYNESYSFHLQ